MSIDPTKILDAVNAVTKKWAGQRKAEERGRKRVTSRAYIYSDRVQFVNVAGRILPAAYKKASGESNLPVAKRQLYYASREQFKERTGREIEYSYFANALLVQYMNRHQQQTAGWKVTADPRGTLWIPGGEGHQVRIPVGTLDIDNYLAVAARRIDPLGLSAALPVRWPSLAPGQRYQGVLYIEKEGFEPLLKEAKIAERFDLAVISCKGQSVVAARKYVDHVCAMGGGVPLFVAHDFDKAGFEISQRLTTVSEWAEECDRVSYEFKNAIDVTDLGLRLADAKEYGLLGETCKFEGSFALDSPCTDEERAYLRSGRRVELNAFTSPQFVEWLEKKLTGRLNGKRLVPSDQILEDAYRRAVLVAKVNAAIQAVIKEATTDGVAEVPQGLREQVAAALARQDTPAPWDSVVYGIAATAAAK